MVQILLLQLDKLEMKPDHHSRIVLLIIISLFYENAMTTIGGPIVIIERNEQDQVLIADLFKELNHRNELVFFKDGYNAFEYLKHQDVYPFLILSDVNIPPAESFELRTKMQA